MACRPPPPASTAAVPMPHTSSAAPVTTSPAATGSRRPTRSDSAPVPTWDSPLMKL